MQVGKVINLKVHFVPRSPMIQDTLSLPGMHFYFINIYYLCT